MIISKVKITIISVASVGIFLLGRATAPKPKPEIKIIDNSKLVEKAIADTKKQMTQTLQKQIIRETHTIKNKAGNSKTDVKEIITFNKNTNENLNQKTQNNLKTTENQTTELKQARPGIDYTFMVGKSFSDAHYDYFASIGVPLFAGIKANGGYEFQDKRIFLGVTFDF